MEAENAVRSSDQLFSKTVAFDVAALMHMPSTRVSMREIDEERPLTEWLSRTGLASSNSEATRLIRGGGVYVNNEAVTDVRYPISRRNIGPEDVIVLGKGKRHKHVLKVSEKKEEGAPAA